MARLHGATFAALATAGEHGDFCALARRLHQVVGDQQVQLDRGLHRLSASVGLACSPEDGQGHDVWDLAMSRLEAARRHGGDQVQDRQPGCVREAG